MAHPTSDRHREMSELERRLRIGAGWTAGLFLLFLAFVSLLHARLAAVIFLFLAARVLPPVRDWIGGLGRVGKAVLAVLGGAALLWLLLLGG